MLLVGMEVFLEMLLHVFVELSEFLSKEGSKQGAGQFEPLLSVVVTIVLDNATEASLEQPVDHIAHKVGLFEGSVAGCGNVRQESVFEQHLGESNPLRSLVLVVGTPGGNEVERVFLGPVAGGHLERGPHHVAHVGVRLVVNDEVLDLLVADDVESAH